MDWLLVLPFMASSNWMNECSASLPMKWNANFISLTAPPLEAIVARHWSSWAVEFIACSSVILAFLANWKWLTMIFWCWVSTLSSRYPRMLLNLASHVSCSYPRSLNIHFTTIQPSSSLNQLTFENLLWEFWWDGLLTVKCLVNGHQTILKIGPAGTFLFGQSMIDLCCVRSFQNK